MTLPLAEYTYETTCTYDNLAKWAHENTLLQGHRWQRNYHAPFTGRQNGHFKQKFKPVTQIKRNSVHNCDFCFEVRNTCTCSISGH